jgi:hypothetical protein
VVLGEGLSFEQLDAKIKIDKYNKLLITFFIFFILNG